MTKEVGRDIGGKIGRVIEVDKWSWQAERAKFMRVRVDLTIEKPLRRGWIYYKYGWRKMLGIL